MRITTAILLLIISVQLVAQTTDEKFNTALTIYQNTSQELNKFNEEDYLDIFELEDDLYQYEKQYIYTYNQFISIYQSDNYTYKFAAGYYAILSYEKLARVYNHQFRYDDAYNILKEISPWIDGTKPIQLPIKYPFEGKNYEVQAIHLQNFKSDYHYNMAETCLYLNKIDESISEMNALLSLENVTVDRRHKVYKTLINMSNKNLYNFAADQKINNLTGYIQNYYQLTPKQRDIIQTDTTEITYHDALSYILHDTKNSKLSQQSVSNIADALLTLSANNVHAEIVFDLYQYVLNNYFGSSNYSGSQYAYNLKKSPYEFFTAVEAGARYSVNYEFKNNDYLSTALNLLLVKEKEKARQVAQQALIKMADLAVIQNNCDQLANTVSLFQNWKFEAELAKYSKLVETCKSIVKKEQERKLRAQKRANSNFNIYAGIYPFGLLTKRENMDFGGVLNFTGKKSAYEFSYLKMANKQENYFDIWLKEIDYEAEDLPKWDGYYTHFQYKAFSGYDPIYTGFLLGYASKNFGEMTADVINLQTNIQSTSNFNPTTKQYTFMINEGILKLGKGYGYDAYFGIGVSYNIFDSGNQTLDRSTHQINNATLQNRKEAYFSYMMRAGITIGLNIGNGNRR